MLFTNFLNSNEVEEEHRNEAIVVIIFTVSEDCTDRFDKTKWQPLKKYAYDALSKDYEIAQRRDAENVYHIMPKQFFEDNNGMEKSLYDLLLLLDDVDLGEWIEQPLHTQIFQAFEILPSVGCQHDINGAQIQCAECKKFYGCARCHDEEEDHTLPKAQTTAMKCRFCHKIQPIALSCIECGHRVARVTCPTCHFLSDVSFQAKPFFHCDACQHCNLGHLSDTIHCSRCGICIAKKSAESHVCREQSECVVCLADLKRSKYSVCELSCGHILHQACYDQLLDSENYQCPVCKRFLPIDEDKKFILQYQHEIYDSIPLSPIQMYGAINVKCCDCQLQFPQYPHIGKMYFCPKCKTFNVEEVADENVTFQDVELFYEENKDAIRPPQISFKILIQFVKMHYDEGEIFDAIIAELNQIDKLCIKQGREHMLIILYQLIIEEDLEDTEVLARIKQVLFLSLILNS